MDLLEAYFRTLWAFLQAVRCGLVVNLPREEDQWCTLRLSLNGAWEVLTTPPETQSSPTMTDLTIPLVLPLVPIILVAHVETQWARSQSGASMASMSSRSMAHS